MAYRGVTARLPVGAQGFTGTRNQSQAGPGHLIYTEGAELDGGLIRKDGGAKMLNQNGTALGLYTSIKTILNFDATVEGDTVIADDGYVPAAVWECMSTASQTLTDKKFGTGSLKLNGTSDYVRASDPISLGVLPWTFHGFINITAATGAAQRCIFGQADNAASVSSTSIYLRRLAATDALQLNVGYDGGNLATVPGITALTDLLNLGWHHFAVVRDTVAQQLRLFLDGVQEGNLAFPNSRIVNNPSTYFLLGALGDTTPSQFFQGFIDGFVICVGKAMWTSAFTPPTGPQTKAGGGAVEPGDTPGSIIAGINWQPGVGRYQDVVVVSAGSGGVVLGDDPPDPLHPENQGTFKNEFTKTLVTTLDPPPYFCVGGGEVVGQPRKLFLFQATNMPVVLPGNYTGNYPMKPVTTPPADWAGDGNYPTFGCVHQQRMFAGGNASDPHRLYYSSITDHQTFTGTGAGAAGTIPVYPGQGEKLIAAYSVRGALILWKYPVGIYVLQTQDPDPTTWSVEVLSLAVGGLNANTVVQIENDVLFLDRHGMVHSLTATNDFGDFNTGNISDLNDMQPFMKEETNRLFLHRAHGLYYTNKRQAWFYVPRKGFENPNLRIQLGIEHNAQSDGTASGIVPRFFLSRRDQASSSWLRPDEVEGIPKPVIGEDDGCIYLLDQDAKNKHGEGYPIEFSTSNTDFAFVDQSLATKQKNGEFMEIVYEPDEGEAALSVDVFWDDRWYDNIIFNLGGAGVALDVFVLDLDVLGSSGVKEVRKRLIGSGRRFRMTARNDSVNDNVSIAEFHISFGIGDERTPEGRR